MSPCCRRVKPAATRSIFMVGGVPPVEHSPRHGIIIHNNACWSKPMSWQPLDALVLVLFATLYAGIYALLRGRGYSRLLVGWLASLAGALIGYFVGHLLNLQILWLG